VYEEFEKTKGVIRIRKSKKKTNNDLKNRGVNPGALKGERVPAPLAAPVVLI